MEKVIEKQYNSSNYPLMLFQWNDLPNYIVSVIEELNALNNVIIRGGVSIYINNERFWVSFKRYRFYSGLF